MPGKPYTMRELKQIVDYLTEHKLYGELKGRKMWMDFANTKKLDRTWQSLKETFQKRILPDIHNPYYKLNLKQVSSFRSGANLEEPDSVKLIIHESDSHSNDNQGNINEASTSKKNGEMSPKGKEPKKVSNKSSSTETLVLDTVESIEDLQNESDGDKTHKPLRDLIIYSEPLTPMLQEVLDDFATDEDEPPLQIVEDNENKPSTQSPSTIRELSLKLSTKDSVKKTSNSKAEASSSDNNETSDKVKPVKLIKTRSGAWENKMTENTNELNNDSVEIVDIADNDSVAVVANATDSIITVDSSQPNHSEDVLLNTQNKTNDLTVNGTPDSLLPNNPEAFNTTKRTSNETITCSNDNNKSDDKKRKGEQSQAEPKRKLRKDKETPIEINTQNSVPENNTNDTKDTTKDGTSSNQDKSVEHSKTHNKDGKTIDENCEDPSTNPCLKSVSLYEAQFSQSKYSDSDDNQVTTTVTKETNNNTNAIVHSPVSKKTSEKTDDAKKINESKVKKDKGKNTYQVDNSHLEKEGSQKMNEMVTSDSGSENCIVIDKVNTSLRMDRRKVLAKVFGFTSGTLPKKRTLSLRDKSKRRYSQHRRRTNTYSILNTVKSSGSTDYSSLSETDDRPSPSKRKCHDNYIKPQPLNIMKCPGGGGLFVVDGNKLYPIVKKDKHVRNFLTIHDESDSDSESYWKAKYLEQKRKTEKLLEQSKNVLPITNKESVTRATSPMIVITNEEGRPSKVLPLRAPSESGKDSVNGDAVSDKRIKIKIGKNYESVELECQSMNGEVINILEKMKAIMNKKGTDNPEPNAVVLSSGKSTPVDPEIHARIDKLESEIFKEIAERDAVEENVNKSKRIRSRKLSSISVSNKSRSASPKDKPIEQPKESNPSVQEPVNDADGTKLVKEAKKITRNKKINPEPEQKEKPRTSARLSSVASSTTKTDKVNVLIPEDDSQVLYKFPTSAPSSRSSSRARKKTEKAKLTMKIPENLKSPNETFGYQDTDGSFVNIQPRKRKSITHLYDNLHVRSKLKRKSDPYYGDDDTNEGLTAPNNVETQNSSLDPELYRSESYQLLMPKPKIVQYLDKIEEGVTNDNHSFTIQTDSQSPNTINVIIDKHKNGSPSGNSSNISFPLSPELSIVENISISKSLLSSVNENPPSINELQDNDEVEVTDLNEYLLSHIDVSVPLMEQECKFLSDINNKQRKELESQNTVTMEEPSSSDSLDQKLRQLLLESAKKMSQTINMNEVTDENRMEVDTTTKATAKKRSKKLCSTPRKKRETKKSKASIEPVIEEHTESCSRISRQSCPAMIDCADKENNNISSASTDKNKEANKVRGKKDIIKVKIQKPKQKHAKKRSKSSSRVSVCTDSGINDTESGVFLQELDDSVELIHNHSDTCLHANECVSESVEFIDNRLNSVISVDSSPGESANYPEMEIGDDILDIQSQFPELFCNNAQDASKATKENNPKETESLSGGTMYHTPNSNTSFNSLFTEDLSDETPASEPLPQKPSKWYLWSEDSASKDNSASVGANLHQIFPVTCAIPNLSTITENSTDSRKITDNDPGNSEASNSETMPSPRSIFDI